MSRYQHILSEKARYPVRLLCDVLQVSPSGFYGWVGRGAVCPRERDTALKVHIKALHKESRGTYGAPRITRDLKRIGMGIGHNRVARLMREEGINGLPRKRWRNRSRPANGLYNARNLLERKFQTDAPDQAWVGDITYIWTKEGWLYLSVLLDIYSRRVVGWAADSRMRTRLCLRSLETAMALRQPAEGLVHHSDRGSQYTSGDYLCQLSEAGLLPSFSRAGDCWDNAVAESFFGTLKTELIHRKSWKTRDEAETAIRDYINRFYNPVRQHSANDGLSPIEAERNFYNNIQRNAA